MWWTLYAQKPLHSRIITKLYLFKVLSSVMFLFFVLSVFLAPVTFALLLGLLYGIVTGMYYATLSRFFVLVKDLLSLT